MMKRILPFLTALAVLAGCCCAAAAESSELPSRYDMREAGIVTPVKLQYPWGSCWAFGTVAAAETSILSAMGKTYDEYPLDLSELHAAWFAKHAITAAENPAQAGEGMLSPRGEEDPAAADQRRLSGGSLGMIGSLFATGAGPVEESVVPYRGREANPEAWVIMKDPEKWMEDYTRFIASRNRVIIEFGEDAAEEKLREQAAEKLREKQTATDAGYYLQWYMGDDWRLPDTDEKGASFRMKRSAFTLTDDNLLPPPIVNSDPENEESPLIPNTAGMDAMKREMLNGHAVAVGYQSETYSPGADNPNLYINYENWAQYTYENRGMNHMICLVGWDDNYPAENFTHDVYVKDENGNKTVDQELTAKTTPPGNGAWLMKNSRGSETDAIPDGMTAPDGTVYPEHRSDWGLVNGEGLHTGYNWISYYDQSLHAAETMAFVIEKDRENTGVLQYDYLVVYGNDCYEKTSVQPLSAANMFTAEQDMELTAVSTRTSRENNRVTFTIVKLNENAADPEDGTELVRFTRDIAYAGYHRTELEKPIFLKKGDRFSVMTTTTCTDDKGDRFWIYSAGQDSVGRANVVVNPGESFVKENGEWQDWTEAEKGENDLFAMLPSAQDNFGIKVFFRK